MKEDALILNAVRVKVRRRIILDLERIKIPDAQRVIVLGANGSGKTTLLRVLSRLQTRRQ